MTGFGTYNQPKGTWSDDSSLTLCLIQNIVDKQDDTALMEKFVQYRDNGYWTPYDKAFDIGRTTDEAIYRYQEGVPADQCGGISEYDNGNGALMRISPLVFTLWNEYDFKKRVRVIEKIAHLTHRHPRSTFACIFYIEYLIRLFHNNEPMDAYKRVINICLENLRGTEYESQFPFYNRILNQEIVNSERESIVSDGYVVNSLEAALWCFLKSENYVDTVLEAVNLGGDTDTIAFIAGTMAGMYYKIDKIPEDWIGALARKSDILNLCERFYKLCSGIEDNQ